MAGNVYIISGVSGSGKSTVSDQLVARHASLARSIAFTTRKPREGERFGVHYFFVSPDIFHWLLETGQMLEYTQVYGDTFYGTLRLSVDRLLEEGKDVLFVVDNRGVEQVTEHFPNAKIAYLRAPSDEEQRNRLIRRGTTGEDLEIRVEKAHEELAWAKKRGWPIVTNDVLETALEEIEGIFFGK